MNSNIDYLSILKPIVVSGGLVLNSLRGKVENKPKKSNLSQEKVKKSTTAHTEADDLVQEIALEILYSKLPNTAINAEEDTHRVKFFSSDKTDLCFHIDPLDGTYAYTKGHAGFAIGAAFSRNLKFFVSAIYFPAKDLFYYAERGKGIKVFTGLGRELSFKRKTNPDNTFVQKRCKDYLPYLEKMNLSAFNSMSAHYTMTALAEGKVKVQLYHEASPHDFGIPKTLVEESGGVCTDLNGNKIVFDEEFNRLPYFFTFYDEQVKDEFFSLF